MIERIDRKRQVLTYVAKYCFEGTLDEHKDHIPLELVPHGSQATQRCCVYREREVLRNRVDWACGRASVYDGIEYTRTNEPVARHEQRMRRLSAPALYRDQQLPALHGAALHAGHAASVLSP